MKNLTFSHNPRDMLRTTRTQHFTFNALFTISAVTCHSPLAYSIIRSAVRTIFFSSMADKERARPVWLGSRRVRSCFIRRATVDRSRFNSSEIIAAVLPSATHTIQELFFQVTAMEIPMASRLHRGGLPQDRCACKQWDKKYIFVLRMHKRDSAGTSSYGTHTSPSPSSLSSFAFITTITCDTHATQRPTHKMTRASRLMEFILPVGKPKGSRPCQS